MPEFTHKAFLFKNEGLRKGRRVGRWIEEGDARVEKDGSINVYLHSTPIGGFDGRIHLAKIGAQPPAEAPLRPGDEGDDRVDETEA
jgi:hypothetical protein